VLAVAGDVDPSQVAEVVEQCFGDWQTPAPARPTIERIRRTDAPCIRVAMANKVQSDLVVGTYAVPRSDPAFYALRVANTLLGQFGMMGRLGERVREEEGLAYYCYSSFVAEQEDGVWLAAAGVPPTAVDDAIESILSEFERLGTQPVPADELADSQAYLTGVVPLTLETNDGVASTLLSIAWHDLGLDYLQRYPGLIYGVTPSDVQRVAATYLDPRRCVRAIAGPEEP
jgi:zinc protease